MKHIFFSATALTAFLWLVDCAVAESSLDTQSVKNSSAIVKNNPYGACAHITRGEPPLRTCSLMKASGMGWVRSDFDWHSIECRQGEWDFTFFDKVVGDCEKAGIQLLPILGYSVPWADPAHEHLDAWGEYVRRVVEHYGERLPVLEVWNEQNIHLFWKNPNPTNYLTVLRRTCEVVKENNPKIRVAFGGTAGIPFAFIEEVYRLGGKDCFDIMNIHPYTHPGQPEGNIDTRIEQLREMMAKYGDGDKPIWITEVGWPTHQMRIDGGDLISAGLQAINSSKGKWSFVYVPARSDDTVTIESLRNALPAGSAVEKCDSNRLPRRLAIGDVDAVVYPFSEAYPADTIDTVIKFVKDGGVLIDFGGMPMWTPFAADRNGRMQRMANHPADVDRRKLRISETAWWMDRHYPKSIRVMPTEFAQGVKELAKGFDGTRFFTPEFLKPGDQFIPLLCANTNGVDAVATVVYKFNSDMKGAVIVSGIFNGGRETSDDERQAKMMARALGISMAEEIENFFWYEFTQVDVDPYDPESYFGIMHTNLAPKPAYGAYWTFIDMRPVGSVQDSGVWHNEQRTMYYPQWKRPNGQHTGMIWKTGKPSRMRLEFASEKCRLSMQRVRECVQH